MADFEQLASERSLFIIHQQPVCTSYLKYYHPKVLLQWSLHILLHLRRCQIPLHFHLYEHTLSPQYERNTSYPSSPAIRMGGDPIQALPAAAGDQDRQPADRLGHEVRRPLHAPLEKWIRGNSSDRT